MTYENRLQLLNWQTLESRRKYCLISYVVKALFGIVNCDTVRRCIFVNVRHVDTVKFVHLRARTQRMHCSTINAFPRYWEELPESLRSGVVETSLSAWLSQLKSHFLEWWAPVFMFDISVEWSPAWHLQRHDDVHNYRRNCMVLHNALISSFE